MMKRILVPAVCLIALAAACAEKAGTPAPSPTGTPPSVIGTPRVPTVPAAPAETSSVAKGSPRFSSTISAIDAPTQRRMSASWRPGCPVPLKDLRLVQLSYWGFDDAPHTGEMVVHEDVVDDVVEVFEVLFGARFPIRRMRLVDEYGGDDARSMAANNTSAFNCRRSAGDASVWSEHAYGSAIDINPIQNPYVSSSGVVDPVAGKAFTDRSRSAPGMILAGGVVVRAFRSIGWGWGGTWERSKDYQHFSRSGR